LILSYTEYLAACNPLKLGNKICNSKYDLPGKKEAWIILYEIKAIRKWIHPFGPPCMLDLKSMLVLSHKTTVWLQ